MRNFIQPGNVLTIPAPAVVASGQVVVVGEIVGVASGAALAGATCDLCVTGVYSLRKVAADALAVGDPVYLVEESGLVTATEGGPRVGVAVAAAGAGSATVAVRLSGF